MIKIGASESSSTYKLFRAFSAWHFLLIRFLGRWPRLLHFAPLALRDCRRVSEGMGRKDYCILFAATTGSFWPLRQLKLLAVLRQLSLPTKSVAQVAGHRVSCVGLAMRNEHLARR